MGDRVGASAAIAHRRGHPLAREGTQRPSGNTSRLPRLRLFTKRRDLTRRGRTRRSPQAERRRLLFEHRPCEGRWAHFRILGGAEGPRLGGKHLLRRVAQGRNVGGMTAPASPALIRCVLPTPPGSAGGSRIRTLVSPWKKS